MILISRFLNIVFFFPTSSSTSTPSKLHLYWIWSNWKIFCCGQCRCLGFLMGCQWIGMCEDFFISWMACSYNLLFSWWKTYCHGIGMWTIEWFEDWPTMLYFKPLVVHLLKSISFFITNEERPQKLTNIPLKFLCTLDLFI